MSKKSIEQELRALEKRFPGHRIVSFKARHETPAGFLRGLKSVQGARKAIRKRGKRA